MISANASSPPADAARLDDDLLCGGCGQNLRGVAADRCPECGQRFDRGRLLSSDVAWETRRYTGRVRAFFQTVWIVTFHPGRLVDAGGSPITLRAARRFRLIVVVLLFLASFGAALSWFLGQNRPGPGTFAGVFQTNDLPELVDLLKTPWFFGTSAIAGLLSLVAVTGVGPLFFAPRRLGPDAQRRGVAASLYSSGLLLWSLLIVPLVVLSRLPGEWMSVWVGESMLAMLAFYVAMLFALGWVMACWLVPCRLLYAVTRSKVRVAVYAIICPLLCAVIPAAIFVGLHAVVTFVTVVRATW